MTDLPNAPNEFLTPDECAEVDKALLTSRDKFTARVAIYALRSLKQIAQQFGVAIDRLNLQQITHWVEQDPTLQPENGFDDSFRGFFARLVVSSLKPLKQIASETGIPIEDLTVQQVVNWFEKEARNRVERSSSPEAHG
ncbi:MAG: hypothetical protein HC769_20735 [Cyanobacteria bacterium CRU_2_1]|nr:hypothetical protein [Cyanobacteria bacterium RU_5_0]NJR61036.1 hypothetical protein [Cyanobacteria bacterium CRU_2_1]